MSAAGEDIHDIIINNLVGTLVVMAASVALLWIIGSIV